MAFGTANPMCSCRPKNCSLSACRLWSCALRILWGISARRHPNLAICGGSRPYHARALPFRVWTRCRRVRVRPRISRRRLDTRLAFMALTAKTAAPHGKKASPELRSNAQWLSSVPAQRHFVVLLVLLRRRRSAASCGSKPAAGSCHKSCNGLVSARRGANLSAKRGGEHGRPLIIVQPTIASTFPQPSAFKQAWSHYTSPDVPRLVRTFHDVELYSAKIEQGTKIYKIRTRER